MVMKLKIIYTYILLNLCTTTSLGTFQNGLNRQMVILFILGLDHSFTHAFKHFNSYYKIAINIAEFQ